MAVTSIWSIKGRVDNVIEYAQNPEKTTGRGAQLQANLHAIDGVVEYAANDMKTEYRCFVTCINCDEADAAQQFVETKRVWQNVSGRNKLDGRVCFHGYQSFQENEVTADVAHEIGVKLAQELWGDRFEVVVATHCNTGHYHNHFVLNSVSFADGYKFKNSPADYARMREVSDRLCREYGLSVIDEPQRGKSKSYGEWRAEQEGRPTWRGLIRADIDEAIRQSMTERQFFASLKSKGYEVKLGKDISVRPPGKERFFRIARNLGDGYTIESIRRKILSHDFPERTFVPEKKVQKQKLKGRFPARKKATGFRALYFHYCYLMGIFPRKKQRTNNQKIHFLLKEDLLKLDAITAEARLLARCHIDTDEQLLSYKDEVLQRIESQSSERKSLQNLLRTVDVKSNTNKTAEVKGRISKITAELKTLRREVHLCDDIAQRSQVMSNKLQILQNEKEIKDVGVKKHEYVR